MMKMIPSACDDDDQQSVLMYSEEEHDLPLALQNPTHVLIATSVPQIPNGIFATQANNLLSVAFPNGLQRIGDRSFFQCTSLLSLHLPSTLRVIGISVFSQCTGLESVKFASPDESSELAVLGDACFAHCSGLKSIHIPSSVISIGKRAFASCDSITGTTFCINANAFFDLSSCLSLTRLDNRLFFSCTTSLKHVHLPPNLRSIGNGVFSQCYELQSVEFVGTSPSFVSIGDQAFASCRSLQSIKLPKSLKTIGKFAFANCFGLRSVEFAPANVEQLETVGDQIFFGCRNLINILLPETIVHTTILGQDIFKACTRLKNRFAPIQNEMNEVFLKEALSIRYHGLPLHSLCYHQGHFSPEETMQQLVSALEKMEHPDMQQVDWTRLIDMFGMSPLHVLAVSSTPNPRLLEALIRLEPLMLLAKDIWGCIPLYYVCCSRVRNATDTTAKMVEVLLQYHAANNEFNIGPKDWDICISAALSNDTYPEFVCVLMQARWAKRICCLGSPKWRDDAILEIAMVAKEQEQSKRQAKTRLAEQKLQDYEKQESIALVRMAAWKIKLDQLQDSSEEKTLALTRKNCWLSCGDEVIVSNVLPFTGFV